MAESAHLANPDIPLDYESLKELAREMGVPAKDLIALSVNTDPFFAALPYRERAAKWFAETWMRLGTKGSHLRAFHYIVCSTREPILMPSGQPYRNNYNDWQYLLSASLSARYLGLVPSAFSDRNAPPPIIGATSFEAGIKHPYVDGTQPPPLTGAFTYLVRTPTYVPVEIEVAQDFLFECWIEKSTMDRVLAPLAYRYGFNLITGQGEMSETAAQLAVARARRAGRPMRIAYITDLDPAGRSMPATLARKIEFILSRNAEPLDIQVNPIALTPDQARAFDLPRVPVKVTERRAAKFEKQFGVGCTELDALQALHPGALARIVEAEAERFLDPSLASRVRRWEQAINNRLSCVEWEVLARHKEDHSTLLKELREIERELETRLAVARKLAVDLWPRMTADLEAEIVRVDPDEIPRARPSDPWPEPLYDSRRTYFSQLDAYRAWQGRD